MKNKKILVVDDEEDITWSLAKGLTKDNPDFCVVCANDGTEALNILARDRIDILVTDIRMPGLNGRQLFEQIRLQHPGIRILVMTAYGSREVSEWLKGFDRVGYIEKPFEFSDLRKKISLLLHKNGTLRKNGRAEKSRPS
jgi:two-component system, NtrC family, response regulator AtoC